MGFEVGCFVGFVHPPEKTYIDKYICRFVNQYKSMYKTNEFKSLLFCWFLSPSYDDHECAYAYVSLSFVRKWNKNRSVNNSFMQERYKTYVSTKNNSKVGFLTTTTIDVLLAMSTDNGTYS